ncbi:hypothetical protein C922_02529 [Plasmodium inui San Antonio 1]|uniref:Uncharacterized protein n=1 Tax=Plasmodium inui San Antonio 1 TaxID=1237626 RepID=W7A5D1_9APIC|nr:hypothetical protein C922_02529 [Plasmodium inui San Antonio 1]EUD66945.1 hypothetical protein C922_02529 [Plasmodium inui San Antonio 1]
MVLTNFIPHRKKSRVAKNGILDWATTSSQNNANLSSDTSWLSPAVSATRRQMTEMELNPNEFLNPLSNTPSDREEDK